MRIRENSRNVDDLPGFDGPDAQESVEADPCTRRVPSRAFGLDAEPPSRPLEIKALLTRWRLAASAGPGELPPFEELALGSLGRLADRAAILRADGCDTLELLTAGDAFTAWIELPTSTLKLTRHSTGRARALHEVVNNALGESRPAHNVAHALVNFVVRSDDIVALPLYNRWGPPLCLVYVHERDCKCNLVEAMFHATAEGLIALALIRDRNGTPSDFQILTLNTSAARLMRRPVRELEGRRLSELPISLGESAVMSRLFAVLDQGTSARFELGQATSSGYVVHLNVGAEPMGDFVAVTLTYIGDFKAREASFRLLFESNPVPMWLCDPNDLAFLAANDAAVAHYGYDRRTFLAMHLFDIVPCEDWDELRARTEAGEDILASEQFMRHLKADGTPIEVRAFGRAITFDNAPARLVAIMDVTEQRQAEARIAHMAHHDALTGLPNRVLFLARLDQALQLVRRGRDALAVLYLDLDHFKNVNDTLGHPIGDQLLCAVAARLRQVLRQGDFVARLGGDEFAIIQMEIAGPEDSGLLAGRLVEALSQPYELDGHHVTIGASVGIALAPGNGDESDHLARNADMALYRAKEDGRQTYRLFSSDMDTRLRARSARESSLREALGKGEFELYYQPLVGLATGAITGFEALLRWNHPSRGLVEPGDFIPLAEEIGVIVPLGEWVLRQACLEAATWPDNLKVAVNLSPIQFKTGNLIRVVMSALAHSGLPPRRLELEITETVLLAESESNLAMLHGLRGLGVGVSIDDFGTGYSSLGYLRAFPFTKIKIDRSFVSGLAENDDCVAIVRAVTGLGSSLGIAITAEGVETIQQLEWLGNEGCTEIQGYLFSRPVPASEIAGLLGRRCPSFPPGDVGPITGRAA